MEASNVQIINATSMAVVVQVNGASISLTHGEVLQLLEAMDTASKRKATNATRERPLR